MTLIVGVTNGREIVVGADTLVYEGSGEVYRTYQTPKLRVVNSGRWIIGFTGLGQVAKIVWDYIEAKGPTFSTDIQVGVLECVKCVGKIYTEHRLDTNATALLAGFCGSEPRIYVWGMRQPAPRGGGGLPWDAIGSGSDVALHYVRNCRPTEDFDVEKLSALVYFCISEIADSDIRVGKPIDISVVSESGAVIKPRESIRHLESTSKRLNGAVRREILGLVAGG